MRRLFTQILFLILFVRVLYSQEDLNGIRLDLSVRYRFEIWDGMNAKKYSDDSPEAIGSDIVSITCAEQIFQLTNITIGMIIFFIVNFICKLQTITLFHV
jgi:hypothetical protein